MIEDDRVTHIGLDCHRKFSNATARDAQGIVRWRKHLEHGDREALRKALRDWAKGTPMILEGTFGWDWFAACRKVTLRRFRPGTGQPDLPMVAVST